MTRAVELWFKTIATGVGGPLSATRTRRSGTAPTTRRPGPVRRHGRQAARPVLPTGTVAPITDITKTSTTASGTTPSCRSRAPPRRLYLDGKCPARCTGKQLDHAI